MFWSQPTVGSGQYLHHLVSDLARNPAGHRFVLVIPRFTTAQPPSIPGCQVVMMSTPFDRRNENLAKLWFEQIALVQICRRLRVDLIHVPYFGSPFRSATPVVTTVHDLIPLLLPAYKGHRGVQAYMRLAAASAKRAAHVIADSEWTRRDILRHLRIPPERVTVTYLAASDQYAPRGEEAIAEVCARLRLHRPYVYYVGGFDRRKNVDMVVRAFAEATQAWSDRPQLVIAGSQPVGGDELFPDINRTILETGVAADVALIGPVTAEDSSALMAGCSAFVFPSRYEGFGLSPLEAMQSGAPVLASSTSSVGEVVAEGGLLIHPDDLRGWADALRQVLADASFAADLRRRGRERAARFNWAKTAAQTLAVYDQAIPRSQTPAMSAVKRQIRRPSRRSRTADDR